MRSILILAATLALLVPSVANACINDRESNQSEKEFKSNYLVQPQQPQSTPEPKSNLIAEGGVTVGVSLLFGAIAIGFFSARKRGD
jgi:hypothetical protein